MAGPHEIAIGIASVLGKPGVPNPLMVSFRGQTLESAAEIVEAIVSECEDAALGIEKIELESDLKRTLVGLKYEGAVPLVTVDGSIGEIRVYSAKRT